jgi:NCS2 family nucleobase:cation symporter-2
MADVPAKIAENEVDDDAGKKMMDICMPTPGNTMAEKCYGGIDCSSCTPSIPCISDPPAPVFMSKDQKLSFVMAVFMGAQHGFGMIPSIATTPKLVAGDACQVWQYDKEMCDTMPYMICATLLASGLCTIVQVLRFKLCKGLYLGTGLISVMGPSFSFLAIAREVTLEGRFEEGGYLAGYGRYLGTCLIASFLEIGLALLPPKILKKIFPPIVTGTAVTLIGAGLAGVGLKYWGGGVFCADNQLSPLPLGRPPVNCGSDSGIPNVFGHPLFVGVGFLGWIILIVIEIFGAPFWKNTSVFIALLGLYFISMGITAEPEGGGESYPMVQFKFTKLTAEEMPIAFFWIKTFPLGVEPAAILPLLVAFFVSSAETVGDIGAVAEASGIPAIGPDAESRIQGGLLSDGVNSFFAALVTTSPNTTYSQNNGVVAITRCASRAAGVACGVWLTLSGLIGPLGGFFADIPACVAGGIVTFLFTNVMISGINTLAGLDITRRNRIILAFALGIGLGVVQQPNFLEGGGGAIFSGSIMQMNYGLWPKKYVCIPGTEKIDSAFGWNTEGKGWVTSCTFDKPKKGLRFAVLLFLKTPYCIGTVVAAVLNALLPAEAKEAKETATA